MHKSWIFALTVALPTPAVAQSTASPASTPDYSQGAAWLCRPGWADACSVNLDVTEVAADGKQRIERFKRASAPSFDCFYVYPTVSNDPTPNSDMTAGVEENAVVVAQAARFASKCRVFAPLYRQVTLTALRQTMMGQAPAVDRAMALADVTAAWHSYLAKDNGGRGVVLIGHSQGSGLLKQLIAQSIEGQLSERKLISAILLGTNLAVPAGQPVGGDLKRIPICTREGQYNCVITYVTFRADSPPPANSRFGKVPQPGMVAACVDPVALLHSNAAANDAIFSTKGPGTSSAPQAPWSSVGAPITTPFVKVPGLISTKCVNQGGFSYLSATVHADPNDPRTDTISGDVIAGGIILKDWGLHLIDNSVTMGSLVDLVDVQARAWRRAEGRTQ